MWGTPCCISSRGRALRRAPPSPSTAACPTPRRDKPLLKFCSDWNDPVSVVPIHDVPAPLRSHLRHAARGGLMSEEQYRYIAAELLASPGSLLVFGLGHDADLWRSCTQGRLAFVEDDASYVA